MNAAVNRENLAADVLANLPPFARDAIKTALAERQQALENDARERREAAALHWQQLAETIRGTLPAELLPFADLVMPESWEPASNRYELAFTLPGLPPISCGYCLNTDGQTWHREEGWTVNPGDVYQSTACPDLKAALLAAYETAVDPDSLIPF